MATEINLQTISLEASADLSSHANRFLKVSGVNTVTFQATAGGQCIGVSSDVVPSTVGAPVTVIIAGVARVEAGAAVTAGDNVKSDTVGRAITAQAAYTKTDDAGAAEDALVGSFVQGVALETAANAGEFIRVLRLAAGAIPTTAA